MGERKIITFEATRVTPIKPISDKMTLFKCYLLALGKNNNGSYLSQETVEKAIPTLYNIPVIGHIFTDEDELRMGGHDKVLQKDENERYILKSSCVPFGVVPSDSCVRFEEVEESDGTKNIYLVADIILWTSRYPELLKTAYNEEVLFGQSMEIDVLESRTFKDDPKYVEFLEFGFDALCLLGKSDDPSKNITPAFPSAAIKAYQFTADENFAELFSEFKKELTACYGSSSDNGGIKRMTKERFTDILVEFNLTEESVGIEFSEEMSEEELRNKLAEFNKDDGNGASGEASEGGEPKDDETQEFSLTYETKMCQLRELVSKEARANNVYYWLCDADDGFVYVRNENADQYVKYGYSETNGELAINFEIAVPIVRAWLTKEEMAIVDALKSENEELKKFQVNTLEKQKKEQYEEILSEFEDLNDNEEFEAIKVKALEFETVDELKKECFALRGKTVEFSKKPEKKRMTFRLERNEEKKYSDFFDKYLSK